MWLWSLVKADLGVKEEYWGTNLSQFITMAEYIRCDKIFFHNLRFDGHFILYHLVEHGWVYERDYEMIVDNMGQWYQITLHFTDFDCVIWDSLKKFPSQSVNSVAKLYGIEGKKEHPFWERYIPVGYKPTEAEIEYCLQDSRILAHAIAVEMANGHKSMTLSADAFNDVKINLGGHKYWRRKFPLLPLDVDTKCRKSYKGGYVYVNPDYAKEELKNVWVFDINSQYPWAMKHCPLPYGEPYFRRPLSDEYYIVKFKTMFELKDGYLPTIQVKNNPKFIDTEYLTASNDEIELTLTCTDFELFKEHYHVDYVTDEEYICFRKQTGLLTKYIDKHMANKEQATIDHDEALRFISKRYLNAPYGKFGMRPKRINRIPHLCSDGLVRFEDRETETDSIYVPFASAVTSYARELTIRSAQKNFDSFVYADTDSLHIIGEPHDEMDVHPTRLGAWKHEGTFETAKYLRPKTYIHGDMNKNILEIKCAGMPVEVKQNVAWDDFVPGATFTGKLMHRHVKGGILLDTTEFTIRA